LSKRIFKTKQTARSLLYLKKKKIKVVSFACPFDNSRLKIPGKWKNMQIRGSKIQNPVFIFENVGLRRLALFIIFLYEIMQNFDSYRKYNTE